VDFVRRHGRLGRWFHAGVYLAVLMLLSTGWWFVLIGYDHRSPLAALTGQRDGATHELAGYALAVVFLMWLPFGGRGIARFIRESLRFRRGDGRWLIRWPRSAFTGRFAEHDGEYDPGQRLANLVMVTALAVLVLSGLGMLFLPSTPIDLLALHRWTTFALTPVLIGHMVVAAGVLPGYRGVWRAMHLGGRLPLDVARRIWPAWLDRVRE
jgi:cytochrome b subunit of formate dehydrogenase